MRRLLKLVGALVLLRQAIKLVRAYLARQVKPVIVVNKRAGSRALPRTELAFRELYALAMEKGSQLTVYVDGALAMDAYGGRSERDVFAPDQLMALFSSTKVIESLAIAMLVDRGQLRYTDRVVDFVPGFYDETLTVALLMQHRAGAAGMTKLVPMAELRAISADAARTLAFVRDHLTRDNVPDKPRELRYHALTRGLVSAVIVHAVTGLLPNDFVRSEIVAAVRRARPDVDVELHIGVPEQIHSRIAEAEEAGGIPGQLVDLLASATGVKPWVRSRFYTSDAEFHRTWLHPFEEDFALHLVGNMRYLGAASDQPLTNAALANSRELRSAQLFSSAGFSNARSMAAILNELALGGGALLSPRGYAAALEPGETLLDQSLRLRVTFTQAGFALDRFGDNGWFGWCGAGGSMALWSPSARAVLSYVPTLLQTRLAQVNGERLLAALQEDLAH